MIIDIFVDDSHTNSYVKEGWVVRDQDLNNGQLIDHLRLNVVGVSGSPVIIREHQLNLTPQFQAFTTRPGPIRDLWESFTPNVDTVHLEQLKSTAVVLRTLQDHIEVQEIVVKGTGLPVDSLFCFAFADDTSVAAYVWRSFTQLHTVLYQGQLLVDVANHVLLTAVPTLADSFTSILNGTFKSLKG